MPFSPDLLPAIIDSIEAVLLENAEDVTALDQAIGDGDHVTNLQRGIEALKKQDSDLCMMSWPEALKSIGMTLMSTVGGASGSLYGTLFIAMSKQASGREMTLEGFAETYKAGVDAVKKRGKAEAGEKTMLDVLIPVSECLQQGAGAGQSTADLLSGIPPIAEAGVLATKDMLASKGRASFLGERSLGHIDAGAKTAQLMIGVIVEIMQQALTTPT